MKKSGRLFPAREAERGFGPNGTEVGQKCEAGAPVQGMRRGPFKAFRLLRAGLRRDTNRPGRRIYRPERTKVRNPDTYFLLLRYSVGDSPACFLKKRPR